MRHSLPLLAFLVAALTVPAPRDGRLYGQQVCPQLAPVGPMSMGATGATPSTNGGVQLAATCEYRVSVTPSNGLASSHPQNTANLSYTFTVKNTSLGYTQDSYTLQCTASGSISCGTVTPATLTLQRGAGDTVTVKFNTSSLGSGTLSLTATGSATGTGKVTIPVGAPVIALAGIPFDNQDGSRCAAQCSQFGYAQSTVPYFSLGAPRAITLVYQQERNITQPFIHVDVQQPAGTPSFPTKYWLQAKLNGAQVTFANGEQTLKFVSQTQVRPERLGAQLDRVLTRQTGVLPLELTVTAEWSGGVTTQAVVTTKMAIVEEKDSPIAQGWTLGGIQRLYRQSDGSALVTDGFGAAAYFGAGISTYFSTPVGEFSWLTRQLSGTTVTGYTRSYPDGLAVKFDTLGRMTSVTDRFSNQTTVAYDGSGRVWKVTDPMNRTITLAYNANGLATITDPGGRTTTVTVQPSRLLTAITDPDTKATSFAYDANARLTTVTDRRGKASTVYYGAGNLVDSVAAPAVAIYGSAGTPRPTTRLRGWQLAGVPQGLTSVTPLNPPWTSDVKGQVTEPGGAITSFTVNRWGQPVAITDPANNVTTTTYDSAGNVVKRVLASYTGATADSTTRDTLSSVIDLSIASGPRRYMRRGPYGLADSIWSAAADSLPTIRNYFGVNGRLDSVRVAGIVRARTRYDVRGRVDSVFDANNVLQVHYHYDPASGNVDTVYMPGGRVTTYVYDAFGRPTVTKAPGLSAQTTFYGLLNRVDSTQASDGTNVRRVKYGYDELFLRSVTDGKGQVDSLFYNDLGWLVRERDPAGASLLSAYSIDGELKQWTNRRGQAINFVYDVLHRPTQKFGTNTDSVSWSYSSPSAGFTTATSPVSTETAYMNVRGQLDSIKTVMAGQTFWRRYRYHRNGALATDSIAGGGLNWMARQYGVDAIGRLTSIKLGNQVTALTSDANDATNSVTFPGGDVDSITIGDLGVALARTGAQAPYAATTDRLLSLDAAGRLQQQFKNVTPARGRFFTYDSLGQLKSGADKHWTTALPSNCLNTVFGYNCQAAGSGWTTDNSITYSYDLAGNRTSQGGTYGPANRITGFNGCTYTTDADGNVTSRTCSTLPTANATFTWSADGQLKSVTQTYTNERYFLQYDAAGYLVRRDDTTGPTSHHLWDLGNPLATLDGSATHKGNELSYYPGLDQLHAAISEESDTIPYYAHPDGGGSVIGVTNASKALGSSFAYDDWGVTNFAGGTDSADVGGDVVSRWKGAMTQWMAGADLYYMRNRWYEPRTGRFLSEDPIGLAGGLNLYMFAANDPVNNADPTGLTCSRWYQAGSTTPSTNPLLSRGTCPSGHADPFYWDRLLAQAEMLGPGLTESVLARGPRGFGFPGGGGAGGLMPSPKLKGPTLGQRAEEAFTVALGEAPSCGVALASFATSAFLDGLTWGLAGGVASAAQRVAVLSSARAIVSNAGKYQTLGRRLTPGVIAAQGAYREAKINQAVGARAMTAMGIMGGAAAGSGVVPIAVALMPVPWIGTITGAINVYRGCF